MASNIKNKKSNTGARKRTTSASNSRNRNTKPALKNSEPKNSLAEDIFFVVMVGLTVILYLANFGMCGKAGKFFTNLSFGLFGAMGYITPAFFLLVTCFFVSNKKKMYLSGKFSLILVLLILTGSFFALFSIKEYKPEITWRIMYDFSMTGRAGGLFGNALVLLLMPKVGKIATFILILILWIVAFLIVTDFSVIDWMEYRIQMWKENSSQNRELKEIKYQELQQKRAVKIEKKHMINQERMQKAKDNLERSIREQALILEKTSNERLGRETKDTRPIRPNLTAPVSASPVVDKTIDLDTTDEIQVNRVKIPSDAVAAAISEKDTIQMVDNPIKENKPLFTRRTKLNSDEERRRIPSFLLSDDEFEKKTGRKRDKDKEPEKKIVPDFVPDDPEVAKVQDKPDEVDLTPNKFGFTPATEEENPFAEVKKQINAAKDPDAPVRKPFIVNENDDEDRVIELSGGRTMNAEPEMGGVKKVEAEGTEKDPHGIGREYEEEDEFGFVMVDKVEKADKPKKAVEKKYKFPPLNLLSKGNGSVKNNREQLKETAERLQQVLKSFGVGASVTDVTCGPSVTRYELTPDTGVKVSKIVGLQDDIKLNLAAADIRIEAPIPGKSAVGIEVPNKEKTGVTIREILESDEFKNHKSKLAFAVGKDIGGANIVGDLAKMPHVLIAGTTGSGKSVCVNSIIVSFIYHATPSEVKMLMIDPKVVELKMYNGIPHLLRPVITDAKQATGALNWAVAEMNRRYKMFAECNVRDLAGYNDKVSAQSENGEVDGLKSLPQIVIIVDELADLMMNAPAEIEASIQHIAQMGRAAGMHLILITQRPTVNVVTGTIKANIPSRIALTVASGTDSRTMIDMVGAEKLMGNGDMLYFPVGMQKPVRLQGPYLSDSEANSIVEYLVKQGDVEGGEIDDTIDQQIKATAEAKDIATAKNEDEDKDPLLYDAGRFIIESDKASIGMLQRKFKVGFNRAARIMDTLAELGVVGPEEGTKPRNIIMTLAQFEMTVKK